MTKAYDKVLYKILLNRLYDIGIRGITHDWFKTYLQNRQQCVEIKHLDPKTQEIKNVRSDITETTHSIPQGSVLGCLLFLIYINELPKALKQTCILFADDISLLTPYTINEPIDLNTTLQNIINNVVDWLTDFNMEINFSKTKIMQFRPYQKPPLDINLTYKGTNIECTNTFTLLGIDIDTNINWKAHVNKIAIKLSRFTYALWELKKTTNEQAAITAYYAYAYSCLSYGIILWGNSTDVGVLFTLQKKCIRIIKNLENTDTCKPHFKSLSILTLVSIYILEACKFVRKNPKLYTKKGDIPRRFPTRNQHKLIMPPSKLGMLSSGPLAMTITIYNKIPTNIKSEESLPVFTRKLKHLLIEKSYYTLNEFLTDKTI